jgi:hypothetical protein
LISVACGALGPAGALRIVEVGEQARAGQRDLHRRLDRCILHPLELGPTGLTALLALSRLEKLARPEEAADDVSGA